MSKKWNLQDIRPAGSHKQPVRPTVSPLRSPQSDVVSRTRHFASESIDPDLASIEIIDRNMSKQKRVILITIISCIILGGAFYVNVLLDGAEIIVYPKTKEVSVQSELTSVINPQEKQLSHEFLTLEASAEKQVPATGKESALVQAIGNIFVYNTKSTTPQRLITNTRFESPEGYIYRIKDSIEVPGVTKNEKGEIVPGKIVAEVFADVAGEEYNIGPTHFTIPGLKGGEHYETVYAESVSPFTGGFKGDRYIINEAELQKAQQELHVELRNTLLLQLAEKKPADFIVYDGAVTFIYESLPSTEYGNSLATIKEKAYLHVPIFKEETFAQHIAGLSSKDYLGEDVYILEPKTLVFSYTDPQIALTDISTMQSLTFTLTGTTKIVWEFDAEKLKSDLLGTDKKQSTNIFTKYKSIENAQAKVRPFWKTAFPKDIKDITITTIVE